MSIFFLTNRTYGVRNHAEVELSAGVPGAKGVLRVGGQAAVHATLSADGHGNRAET